MSERIRVSEPSGVRTECGSEVHADPEAPSENGVREPTAPLPPAPTLSAICSPPAHPSNRLVAQLNTNWRVVNDPLQWVLQRRKGNPRKKNSGWKDRSFCTTRDALFRCVREYCGDVDQNALATLQELPDHHVDREWPK